MAVRMLLSGVCLVVAVLTLAAPAPAAASSCEDDAPCAIPRCWAHDAKARPGLERYFEITCFNADSVELIEQPAQGEVREVVLDYWTLHFLYRPDEDATGSDTVRLRVRGPGGTIDHEQPIEIVPKSFNSPPRCDPVTDAQRTLGLERVVLEFHVYCHDPDHDELTYEGAGPGEHLDSPLYQRGTGTGSNSVPFWRYRPATQDGDEQATYFATDVLGARSADAPISVKVGPSVDRKPWCHPNPYGGPDVVSSVITRPDRVRRFEVICEDADGDLFVPAVSDQPDHGVITLVPGEPGFGFWGVESWSDTTYVPTEASERDEFTVTATGAFGSGSGTIAMVTRPPEENSGVGSCGGWGGHSEGGAPAVLRLGCDDPEGDPVSARIVRAPEHGTAAGPVVTKDARFGGWTILTTYTPEPGFVGLDCVIVRVEDDRGEGMDIRIDVPVTKAFEPPPPPPLPDPPTVPDPVVVPELPEPTSPRDEEQPPPVLQRPLPGSTQTFNQPPAPRRTSVALPALPPPPAPAAPTQSPSVGQAPAIAPVDQARAALGTRAVTLVRSSGDTRVYAARGRLAITCAVRCSVMARPLGRAVASSLRRATGGPGRAAVLRFSRGTKRVRVAIADALGRRAKVTVSLR